MEVDISPSPRENFVEPSKTVALQASLQHGYPLPSPPLLHGHAWPHQTFAKPATLHTHHTHHHSCSPPLVVFQYILNSLPFTTFHHLFHSFPICLFSIFPHTWSFMRMTIFIFPSHISIKPIHQTRHHIPTFNFFHTYPTCHPHLSSPTSPFSLFLMCMQPPRCRDPSLWETCGTHLTVTRGTCYQPDHHHPDSPKDTHDDGSPIRTASRKGKWRFNFSYPRKSKRRWQNTDIRTTFIMLPLHNTSGQLACATRT